MGKFQYDSRCSGSSKGSQSTPFVPRLAMSEGTRTFQFQCSTAVGAEMMMELIQTSLITCINFSQKLLTSTTVDQRSRNSSQRHNYICVYNDVPTTCFGRFLTGHHQVGIQCQRNYMPTINRDISVSVSTERDVRVSILLSH